LVRPALQQAHTFALAHVDGWKNDHP